MARLAAKSAPASRVSAQKEHLRQRSPDATIGGFQVTVGLPENGNGVHFSVCDIDNSTCEACIINMCLPFTGRWFHLTNYMSFASYVSPLPQIACSALHHRIHIHRRVLAPPICTCSMYLCLQVPMQTPGRSEAAPQMKHYMYYQAF